MTDTDDKLYKIAGIGRDMIAIQLDLASKQPKEALNDTWVLGYCFGMLDALAQRAKLDQYPDGLGLITSGFIELISGGQPNRTDELLGADMVKKALDSQADTRFLEGNQAGGTDLFAWCADTKKAPLALSSHLRSAG
jgi:hypothetical protein